MQEPEAALFWFALMKEGYEMQDGAAVSTSEAVSDENAQISEPTSRALPKPGWLTRKSIVVFALCVSSAGIVIAGLPVIEEFLSHVETENAYLTGHVHTISPRIAGTVKEVLVEDNQLVKAGDVLVVLDDRDEVIKLRKAQAHLEKLIHDVSVSSNVVSYAASSASAADKSAEATIDTAVSTVGRQQQVVKEAEYGISVASQNLVRRQAESRKAELDLKRYASLEKAGAISTEELETARRNFDVANASRLAAAEELKQSRSKLRQAESQVGVAEAQLVAAKASELEAKAARVQVNVNSSQKRASQAAVQEAQVDLDNARLQLSYARITAPIDGRVGRKSVEIGQRVQPGSPLLAVVGDQKWIVANFKETQLRDIKVGQPVKVTVDTFGDHVFEGKVDSLSPASGAAFALLPPDNATGNFTKIVQRIPIKIVLDEASLGSFKARIAPGMSCVVKVKVR